MDPYEFMKFMNMSKPTDFRRFAIATQKRRKPKTVERNKKYKKYRRAKCKVNGK